MSAYVNQIPDPSPFPILALRGEGGAGARAGGMRGGWGASLKGEERERIEEANRGLEPVRPPSSDLAERPNFALAVEVSVCRHYVK